jgi:amino acid transporter
VILVITPEKSTNEFVYTTYYNSTGFSSPFYVCMMGVLFSCYSFTGYEAGAHMAEETAGASKSAPKGIVYTCVITSITGFIYILGLLYAIVD